jgi:hypothetical protein
MKKFPVKKQFALISEEAGFGLLATGKPSFTPFMVK